MNSSISVTVLGGQEEVGLNSTVVEVDNDIVIIDLGNNFEDSDFGVSYYLPNIESLLGKTDRIRGIFITHGHYDHRAALPFLIDKLGFPPVYGSPFTIQLIKQHLKGFKKVSQTRLIPLQPRQEINLGKIQVKAVHLTHSIIGTYGYFLKTIRGNLFHSGDFKFDDTPFREKATDYQSLREIGRQGVLVAFIDSTRATSEGHSQSETEITQNLEKLIREAPGRIIVSTFAQMLSRINQIALIGKKYQRQIFIKGRTLEKTTQIGKQMGLFDKSLKIRDAKQMEQFPDREILLFATGSQGEEKAALARMLEAKKGLFKVKPTDTIILSSSTIPSNIVTIQKLVDRFADRGCRVFTDDIIDIHAGGHGHQDEIKKMIQLLKPKFIFPVQGYISFRHQLGFLARSFGYRKNEIILAKNNQPVLINRQGFKKTSGKTRPPTAVIENYPIKNGAEIVFQRKKAALRGLLTVFINPQTRQLKTSFWGVPEFIKKEIKIALQQEIIAKRDPQVTKRKIEDLLWEYLDEELIPAIKVEISSN
ncbi:MAG: ribonuclease J [Candidatus Pacebacteria bacterium]|nr:ribonuclease J [Candidatus Paceibacterota bacterium]